MTEAVEKEVNNNIEKTLVRSVNSANTIFDNVDKCYRRIISSNSLTNLLVKPNITDDSKDLASSMHEIVVDSDYFVYYLNDIVEKMYVYSECNDYIYAFMGNSSKTVDRFTDKKWLEHYLADRKNYITMIKSSDGSYELVFCYGIFRGRENIGALAIMIDSNSLKNTFSLDDESERIVITGGDNTDVIYDSGIIADDVIKKSMQLSNEMTMTFYASSEYIKSGKVENRILLSVFVILSILFAVIFAYIYAKKQYKSIVEVISAIESGEFNNEKAELNEIGYLISKSKAYLLNEKKIEDELVLKISELKKAQVVALQSQINPHFVSNTLNLISSTIIEETGGDTEAVNMIKQFSRILNSSMRSDEYIVFFEQELKMAVAYSELMKLKYDNSFSINWYIDRSLYNTRIIKTVLQPIIENAVEHGIRYIKNNKDGIINVYAYQKDDDFCIKVTDNGKGMTQQEINALKETLNSDKIYKNKHIGLNNIESRVKILYGDKYGLDITREEGLTTVTLVLPIQIDET